MLNYVHEILFLKITPFLPFHAALSVFWSNTSFAGSAHRRRTKLAVFLVAVTAGPLSRGTKTIGGLECVGQSFAFVAHL